MKSTLFNLPTYFLSFPNGRKCGVSIKKLYRAFLWSGIGDAPKYHLVKWENVCSSITCGRLDIRNLRIYNQALLGK